MSLKDWFYSTWAGGAYLEFLLWVDRRKSPKETRYLTPKEMATIIRESHKIAEGTELMKQRINNLVTSKDKAGYEVALSGVEELIQFAKGDSNTAQGQFAAIARQMYVKKGSQDIVTATDRAKMVDQRILDMYELQDQRARQQMWRKIRKLRNEGKMHEADGLLKEWRTKYGRNSN